VTGIPNFDDAKIYLDNNFPYRNFVLAVTSPSREAFKWDNRPKFIQRVREVAAGRQIIFKLHPNENVERSRAEIEHYAPEALILVDGNTNHMIANCDVLFTQYSSAVYVGMALGKQVFSYFDLEMLRKLSPLQNGGDSARRIANLARNLIAIREQKKAGVSGRAFQRPKRNIFDTP
jgi:CDP-glycerol glycerophosphotransferase (TagB/SpsB family)